MKQLEWGKRTYIMGIMNITPDSFSGDGILSQSDAVSAALKQAKQFIADGADILDLGAESSRPGSETIPSEVEIERVLTVLKAVRSEISEAIISIDTYKAETAEICLDNGADWINDIWGLRADMNLAKVVANHNASVVLMHNRSSAKAVQNLGDLGRSYSATEYDDVMDDINSSLSESVALAKEAGIADDKIILDPGIGFGKSVEDNLAIINRLDEMKNLGYPVLIGPSRKSFIGQVLDLPVTEREEGTAASIAIGIARGADIIRVHDVGAMARIARMSDAILKRLSSV
jgi:dihydropteroate synthase